MNIKVPVTQYLGFEQHHGKLICCGACHPKYRVTVLHVS
jgi:hypothetical protein